MPTAASTTSDVSVAPRGYLPRVIATGSVALALTAPGQTAAVSVFVDPMIAELGVSRSAVSTAYLVGSLSGAFVMPLLGRGIDRLGPRGIMAWIAVAFGAVLMASSLMSGPIGMTASFVGIRVGGQGALNLVATTTVALYVQHRRGFAIGLVSALGTAGISLAPMALERLIATAGWRQVWFGEGLLVWLLVIPAALLLLPRRPLTAESDHGHARPDPARPVRGHSKRGADGAGLAVVADPRVTVELPPADWTLSQAMRTGMFWVVVGGVAACSLIATGLNFQQQSLLGERGLSATEAAATFLPQTVAGLAATFALGWLADRFSDRALIITTMLVLSGATLGAGWLAPGLTAIVYGVALGACGNGVRTLEAVAFPRIFGLSHLGAIRGVVHSVTVGASAFGPLLLALGRAHATSYRPALIALSLLPVLVVAAALVVRPPGVPRRRAVRGHLH